MPTSRRELVAGRVVLQGIPKLCSQRLWEDKWGELLLAHLWTAFTVLRLKMMATAARNGKRQLYFVVSLIQLFFKKGFLEPLRLLNRV